jgi:hypothetical protein
MTTRKEKLENGLYWRSQTQKQKVDYSHEYRIDYVPPTIGTWKTIYRSNMKRIEITQFFINWISHGRAREMVIYEDNHHLYCSSLAREEERKSRTVEVVNMRKRTFITIQSEEDCKKMIKALNERGISFSLQNKEVFEVSQEIKIRDLGDRYIILNNKPHEYRIDFYIKGKEEDFWDIQKISCTDVALYEFLLQVKGLYKDYIVYEDSTFLESTLSNEELKYHGIVAE